MSSQERIETFEGTRQLCLTHPVLQASIAASRAEQKIYWEEDPLEYGQPRFRDPCRRILSGKKTVEAARQYAEAGKRVCILNFASSVCPGGGVLYGSQAQEESISRVSTLWFALSHPETAGQFYDRHWELIRAGKMNRKNRDDIIYTPGILAIRDDADGEQMMEQQDWYAMDVITCAAPDLRPVTDSSGYAPDRQELRQVHELRWSRILAAAARHQADVLILGAFGCGVFGNPPELVVKAFNNVADGFDRYFETIEFAVYSSRPGSTNARAFREIRNIRCENEE